MHGLRVLTVRPANSDDALPELLRREGCIVHSLPVMIIAPLATAGQRIQQQLQSAPDILLFVSPNAARIALALAGEQLSTVPLCFAVGEGTARVLKAGGLTPLVPANDFSSEGLLALPQLQQLRGSKLLLLKGAGGRELLQKTLRERGADVVSCELYQRELCTEYRDEIQTLLAQNDLDILMVHSGELLRNLLQLADRLTPRLLNLPLVVPGERVAAQAAEAGFSSVIVAANAVAHDMVSALQRWYSETSTGPSKKEDVI